MIKSGAAIVHYNCTTRPLIQLSEPDHAKLLESKQFKNKLNRLKRVGKFGWSPLPILKILKAIWASYRFSMILGLAQCLINTFSEDDPRKKEFFIELFRLQLLHSTILKVNGEIFAAVVAISGKG